jgi:hypothetical protein
VFGGGLWRLAASANLAFSCVDLSRGLSATGVCRCARGVGGCWSLLAAFILWRYPG